MRTPGTCSPRGPAGEEGREFIGKRGVWPCTPRCLTRGPATAPRSRLQLPALPARPGPHRLPRRPCGDLAGARFGDGAPAKKATRCSGLRAAQVGGLEEEVVSALPFPRRAQTWGARRAALHPRCNRGAWSETRGETLTGNASESPAPLCPTHRFVSHFPLLPPSTPQPWRRKNIFFLILGKVCLPVSPLPYLRRAPHPLLSGATLLCRPDILVAVGFGARRWVHKSTRTQCLSKTVFLSVYFSPFCASSFGRVVQGPLSGRAQPTRRGRDAGVARARVRGVRADALSSRGSARTRERAGVLEEGWGKGALSGGRFSSTRVTKPPKLNHTQWAGEAVASHTVLLEIQNSMIPEGGECRFGHSYLIYICNYPLTQRSYF